MPCPWADDCRARSTAHNVCLLTGPVVADRRAGLPPHLVDALAQAAASLGIAAITVEADGSKMRPAKAPAEHEPVLPATTTLLAPVLGLDADRRSHRFRVCFIATNWCARCWTCPAAPTRFTPGTPPTCSSIPPAAPRHAHLAARLLPIFNKADTPLRLLFGRLAARHLAAQGQPSLLTAVGDTSRDAGDRALGDARRRHSCGGYQQPFRRPEAACRSEWPPDAGIGLGCRRSAAPVTHFEELGVLHLLAEIPTDDLARYPDVLRVAGLEARGTPVSDLDLLERYLATMSLRQTAQQVLLHHTTVQYRLKRIEQHLGTDLQDPAARLRTQIAILLYRIERAAAATSA